MGFRIDAALLFPGAAVLLAIWAALLPGRPEAAAPLSARSPAPQAGESTPEPARTFLLPATAGRIFLPAEGPRQAGNGAPRVPEPSPELPPGAPSPKPWVRYLGQVTEASGNTTYFFKTGETGALLDLQKGVRKDEWILKDASEQGFRLEGPGGDYEVRQQ